MGTVNPIHTVHTNLTQDFTNFTTKMARNQNPGNFSNRPQEEVENIASKGGQSSHSSGFASMDSDKQHDIASKGGQHSGGSFQPGDERAKEAGRKGGKATGQGFPEE